MEVISEKQISSKQAGHFLRKMAKDSFLEENNPELAKNVSLVSSEFSAHAGDIVVPEQEEPLEEPEAPAEEETPTKKEEETERKDEEKPRKRKHHSKKENTE